MDGLVVFFLLALIAFLSGLSYWFYCLWCDFTAWCQHKYSLLRTRRLLDRATRHAYRGR